MSFFRGPKSQNGQAVFCWFPFKSKTGVSTPNNDCGFSVGVPLNPQKGVPKHGFVFCFGLLSTKTGVQPGVPTPKTLPTPCLHDTSSPTNKNPPPPPLPQPAPPHFQMPPSGRLLPLDPTPPPGAQRPASRRRPGQGGAPGGPTGAGDRAFPRYSRELGDVDPR